MKLLTSILAICLLVGSIFSLQSCRLFIDPLLGIKQNFNKQPCSGNKCVVLSGRVTSEENSLISVNNAKIELVSWRDGGGIFYSPRSKIAQLYTDDQGNYKIEFNPSDEDILNGHFSVLVSKNDYYTVGEDFWLYTKKDTSFTQNTHLPKMQKIKLIVKGYEQAKSDERLEVSVYYKSYDETNFRGGSSYRTENGISNYEITKSAEQNLLYDIAANQYAYIYVNKNKNGQTISLIDSVFCPSNQVSNYVLNW
jgi:hypothetical protein